MQRGPGRRDGHSLELPQPGNGGSRPTPKLAWVYRNKHGGYNGAVRASRCVGFTAILGWACCAAGCDSDDDPAATAAGTGGAPIADGGHAGGAGNAGDASASAGDAGDAGDANAGAAGESSVVPYANVVALSVASGSDGAYAFSVSIESSDIDCSQYANWWEVLTEDGALSYRRILEHSHTDANGSSDADQPGNTFTRLGGPVPIDADTVVLVRAHLSTGGYNGRVMRGSAREGFTQAPEIGADFATDVEDDPPQSTGCAF